MKISVISSLLLLLTVTLSGQENRATVLQNLEKGSPASREINVTATTRSATRLFGDSNDLTSVITIIPNGTVVGVLGSDSTFLNITFEDTTGYIFKRHAVIESSAAESKAVPRPANDNRVAESQQEQPQVSRFSYLESKYGTNMAARLSPGKIWKGMDSEMIRDSWGNPQKINRVISGNTVKEEWIFKNTWLYVENDVLLDWGPIRR